MISKKLVYTLSMVGMLNGSSAHASEGTDINSIPAEVLTVIITEAVKNGDYDTYKAISLTSMMFNKIVKELEPEVLLLWMAAEENKINSREKLLDHVEKTEHVFKTINLNLIKNPDLAEPLLVAALFILQRMMLRSGATQSLIEYFKLETSKAREITREINKERIGEGVITKEDFDSLKPIIEKSKELGSEVAPHFLIFVKYLTESSLEDIQMIPKLKKLGADDEILVAFVNSHPVNKWINQR